MQDQDKDYLDYNFDYSYEDNDVKDKESCFEWCKGKSSTMGIDSGCFYEELLPACNFIHGGKIIGGSGENYTYCWKFDPSEFIVFKLIV